MNEELPEKLSSVLRKVGLYGSLFFLLLWIAHFYYMKEAYEREGRFTVCVMDEKIPRTSGGFALKYSFRVKGEKFTDDVYLHARNNFARLDHHYLVEFIESNPKLHRVLFKKPVRKGADIPPEGWEQIPEYLLDETKKD